MKGCTNPDTQQPLPFDFGVYHDTILIELDGEIRHFGRGWGGAADDRGVPQRDFQKEHWAMQQGKVVVRLLQTDVYHDRWSWEGFLISAIQHATCLARPCVVTLQYQCGIYRRLRSDLTCKRSHFRPSGSPYLEYGAVTAEKDKAASGLQPEPL